VYPETVFSFLVVACAGLIVYYFKRDKLAFVALAAVSGGLAVLARPNFVGTLPFLALVFLFADVRLSRRWLAVGVFVFVSVISLIPRPLYNYLRHDVIALTGADGGYALFLGNNPTSTPTGFNRTKLSEFSKIALTLEDDAARDGFYRAEAIRYIKDHPVETAKRWLVRPLHFFHFAPEVRQADFTAFNRLFKWVNLIVYGPVLLLWIAGFFVLKKQRILLPLNTTILSMAVVLVPVTMRVRYRIPVEPLMIIIAAGTTLYIANVVINRIKNRKNKP
jgi:4-amino-4-deoxy-L-arabinose transferase-like glycosyltransferase